MTDSTVEAAFRLWLEKQLNDGHIFSPQEMTGIKIGWKAHESAAISQTGTAAVSDAEVEAAQAAACACGDIIGLKEMRRALESFLAARQQPVAPALAAVPELEQWRDIATAPKDGTEIILRRGKRVGAAQWCKWPGTEDEECGEGWTVGLDGDFWSEEKAPTQWQPMPQGQEEFESEDWNRVIYEGAREDLLDWKRRALRAEKNERQLARALGQEVNGETFMGEPVLTAQPQVSPAVPAGEAK